jgi:hypothetical protein
VKEKPVEKKVLQTNEISAKTFGLWNEEDKNQFPEPKLKQFIIDKTISPKKILQNIE